MPSVRPCSSVLAQPMQKAVPKTVATCLWNWSMPMLRDYVLPELKPELAYGWVRELDHIQHDLGAGAPEALAAILNDDRQIGLV